MGARQAILIRNAQKSFYDHGAELSFRLGIEIAERGVESFGPGLTSTVRAAVSRALDASRALSGAIS
jgi:hypothetical protein